MRGAAAVLAAALALAVVPMAALRAQGTDRAGADRAEAEAADCEAAARLSIALLVAHAVCPTIAADCPKSAGAKVGTGFVVVPPGMDRAMLLTAHRVVAGAQRVSYLFAALPGDWTGADAARVHGVNPGYDIALLEIPPAPRDRVLPLRMAGDPPARDQALIATGHKGRLIAIARDLGRVTDPDGFSFGKVTRSRINRVLCGRLSYPDLDLPIVALDEILAPRDNGAPVFDTRGLVLGMAHGRLPSSGRNFAWMLSAETLEYGFGALEPFSARAGLSAFRPFGYSEQLFQTGVPKPRTPIDPIVAVRFDLQFDDGVSVFRGLGRRLAALTDREGFDWLDLGTGRGPWRSRHIATDEPLFPGAGTVSYDCDTFEEALCDEAALLARFHSTELYVDCNYEASFLDILTGLAGSPQPALSLSMRLGPFARDVASDRLALSYTRSPSTFPVSTGSFVDLRTGARLLPPASRHLDGRAAFRRRLPFHAGRPVRRRGRDAGVGTVDQKERHLPSHDPGRRHPYARRADRQAARRRAATLLRCLGPSADPRRPRNARRCVLSLASPVWHGLAVAPAQTAEQCLPRSHDAYTALGLESGDALFAACINAALPMAGPFYRHDLVVRAQSSNPVRLTGNLGEVEFCNQAQGCTSRLIDDRVCLTHAGLFEARRPKGCCQLQRILSPTETDLMKPTFRALGASWGLCTGMSARSLLHDMRIEGANGDEVDGSQWNDSKVFARSMLIDGATLSRVVLSKWVYEGDLVADGSDIGYLEIDDVVITGGLVIRGTRLGMVVIEETWIAGDLVYEGNRLHSVWVRGATVGGTFRFAGNRSVMQDKESPFILGAMLAISGTEIDLAWSCTEVGGHPDCVSSHAWFRDDLTTSHRAFRESAKEDR